MTAGPNVNTNDWREQVVFLDTETTGLDVSRHEVWDLAFIYWRDGEWVENQFYQIPSVFNTADPGALRVNNYYHVRDEKHDFFVPKHESRMEWAHFAYQTQNKHLVAAVPDFDAKFCEKELYWHGLVPAWHYHLVDIEAMMVGYLEALVVAGIIETPVTLPWRSKQLAEKIGVPFDEKKFGPQHSALADARWVKACFEKIKQTKNG